MSEEKKLTAKAKKAKKPAKLKKVVYPSKTTLNLAMKEKTDLEPKRLIPALAVVLVLLAVFAKFGVVDRLQKVSDTELELATLETTRSSLQAATAEYDEVFEMYTRYSDDWMTEEQKAVVPTIEILDLLEKHLMTRGQVLALSTSGGTISVDVGNIDLQIAADFVEDLYTLPTVADVRVFTAESESPSSQRLRVSFIINMIPQSVIAEAAEQGGDAE